MNDKTLSTNIALSTKLDNLAVNKAFSFSSPTIWDKGSEVSSIIPDIDTLDSSQDSQYIENSLAELKSPLSPATLSISSDEKLDANLFDATASVKILMSQVAMHFDQQWRDKLFNQIDSLHDLDEWDEDDFPINKPSFATFIKAMFQINPKQHPGLGLSHKGNLIAVWRTDGDQLTTEFLPDDQIQWMISRFIDRKTERATGLTSVSRLLKCLAPYDPKVWFKNEEV